MARLTIGIDPELILTDQQGNLVKAGDLLRKEGKFGVDGHAYIAELRPDHAVFPRDLVSNIKKTLAMEVDKLKDYKWFAGPWLKEKPLGGHIHFGTPFEARYVDALDHQLGIILALVEPGPEAKMRRTTTFPGARDGKPYGLLSDIREKKWGFEYRTPSSFIVSPGVTLGILSVAKAIIFEELEKAGMAWSKLPAPLRKELSFTKEQFNDCEKNVFNEKLDSLWKVMRGMRYFQKGEEGNDLWPSVAYLRSQVIPRQGFITHRDIKSRWGLVRQEALKIEAPVEEKKPLVLDEPFWGNQIKLLKKMAGLEVINFGEGEVVAMEANEVWDNL